MPQILIGILALVLAFYVLAFAFSFALGSIIPISLGLGIYFLSCSQARDSIRKEVLSDAANTIKVTLLDKTLSYSVNVEGLKKYISKYEAAVATARFTGLAVSGILFPFAYLGGAFGLALVISEGQFPRPLMFILAGVACIGGTEAVIRWRHKPPSKSIEQLIHTHIQELNLGKPTLDAFMDKLKENQRLRDSLGIAQASIFETQLRDILLGQRTDELKKGTVSIAGAVGDLLTTLETDNANLLTATKSLAKAMSAFRQASQAANRSGNLALLYALDDHGNGIKEAPRLLLSAGRYPEFYSLMDDASEELGKLKSNADDLSSATFDDSNDDAENMDPYAVLGVRSDLSNSDLQDFYRKLANLYHPDKGMAPDHKRFQQINGAWKKITAARRM